MELIYFILCSYGLTQLLCFASIFNFLRPNHHFFSCPMCVGFWSGVFLFGINQFTELFNYNYNFMNMLLLGCLSSGTSYALSMLIGDEGINVNTEN